MNTQNCPNIRVYSWGVIQCKLEDRNKLPAHSLLDTDYKVHKGKAGKVQVLVVSLEFLCIGKMDPLLVLQDRCMLVNGC